MGLGVESRGRLRFILPAEESEGRLKKGYRPFGPRLPSLLSFFPLWLVGRLFNLASVLEDSGSDLLRGDAEEVGHPEDVVDGWTRNATELPSFDRSGLDSN